MQGRQMQLPMPAIRSVPRLRQQVRRALAGTTPTNSAPFLLLAGLAAAYANLYAWTCDDAHISFRYAQNLASGHGLVFNRGEKVEGYTNFLWVLELAGLYRLTGLSFAGLAGFLSLTFSAGTFIVTLLLARRSPVVALRYFVALAAFAWLALNRNVALWSTSGLETRQLTFFVMLAVLWGHRARPPGRKIRQKGSQYPRQQQDAPRQQHREAREARKRRRRLLGASLCLAAAYLTRPEGALVFVAVVGWYLLESARQRSWSPRSLVNLVAPFTLISAAHLIFRYLYYGQWLPNTYYTKVVRPWPDAGFDYLAAAGVESALYLVIPLALLGSIYRLSHGRDSLPALAACIIVPHAAYVTRVGGDHFEFRPFDLYWPLIALAMAEGLALLTLMVWMEARRRRWFRPRLVAHAVGYGGALIVLAYTCSLQAAQYALTYEQEFEREHVNATLTPRSFPLAFVLPYMDSLAPVYNKAMRKLLPHAIAVRWREHDVFSRRQQDHFSAYGRPRRSLPQDAVMAYPYVGVAPLYLSELTVIDQLGLTDATVARHGNPANAQRVMAHDRFPPPGYLKRRGVNIEVLPAARSLGEALERGRFAAPLAPQLWMPFESKDPTWARRAFRGYPLYERPQWPRDLSSATAIFADRKLRGRLLVGDFEAGLGSWETSGSLAAMTTQPYGQNDVIQQQGRGWLSSFGTQKDAGKGTAKSPPIFIQPNDVLTFWVAGGSGPRVGVELLVEGQVVQTWRGHESEVFRPVFVDMSVHAGQQARLRVFDHSHASWGHIMLDQVAIMH